MIKTVVTIDGMMCGMCESHINDAIRGKMDVKKVSSSHSKGETVIISENCIDEDRIRSIVEETGYKVITVQSEEYSEKKGIIGKLFSR